MSLNVSAIVLPSIPPVAMVATQTQHLTDISLMTVAIVLLGLLFGAMWRASDILHRGGNWLKVRSDLFVSSLAGGANAIIAIGLIQYIQTGTTMSLVIAMLVGATGVRGVHWAHKIILGMLEQKFGTASKVPDE